MSKNNSIFGLYKNSKLIGTSSIQNNSSYLKKAKLHDKNCSTFGILIFDNDSLGQGLGKVLVWCVSKMIFESKLSKLIAADMKKNNYKSLKSFLACGFNIIYEDDILYKIFLDIKHLKDINHIEKINFF